MSNNEVIIKYIVDDYIGYKKSKNKKDLKDLRQRLEDFLHYVCFNYSEFEELLEEYYQDDLEYLHKQFDDDEDGQSLMELEQEEYYSNVIAPQKF